MKLPSLLILALLYALTVFVAALVAVVMTYLIPQLGLWSLVHAGVALGMAAGYVFSRRGG